MYPPRDASRTTSYQLRDRAGEWFPYSKDTLFLPIYVHEGEWWCSKCRFSSKDFSKLLGHERRHGSIALLRDIRR